MTNPAALLAVTPIPALGPSWLNPGKMLEAFGSYALIGIVLVIIAETGLLVGFFLPGDSLLFTAGLLTSDGIIHQPIWVVASVTALAAFIGDQIGYLIGYRAGPRLFDRPDSRLFKRGFVEKTHAFFEHYGARAIILARFVPIVRTFMPVTAGISRMPYRRFAPVDAIGALIWGSGVTVAGYFLGQVEFLRNNIELLLLAIVVVSVLPPGVEIVRHWVRSRRAPAPLAADSAVPDEPTAAPLASTSADLH